MPIEKIYRDKFLKENPDAVLLTTQEFADKYGTTLSVIRAAVTRYADQVPEVVKLVNGRLKYYAESEFLKFFNDVTTRTHDRSPLEVARSEVARIKMTLQDTEERVEKRREDLAKAERDLRKFREQLKGMEERVALEEKNEQDKAARRVQ